MWRSSAAFISLLSISVGQAQQYIVSTVAGGVPPATPVAALQASIQLPGPVVADGAGNVYFGAVDSVFKLDAKGILTRVAGTSRPGYSGDNGPATSAQLAGSTGLAFDGSGNLYIADAGNARVRRVSPTGIITTVAGTGITSYTGDGGPATSAQLDYLRGLALDAAGNLYITQSTTIRKVSVAGIITTVAGSQFRFGFAGDGGPATAASLRGPSGVGADVAGNIYIADTLNNRIRKVSPTGIISTAAAFDAATQQNQPISVTVDTSANIYFTTNGGYIGKVSSAGLVTTIAGAAFGVLQGFAGDGGPANTARICGPSGVTVDAAGNLIFSDLCNNRIRKISATGIINTVAGNGSASYSGDGGPAVQAQLSASTIATDAAGNLYAGDSNGRVRMLNAAGAINTIAGNGSHGFSGDGGPATSAQLLNPYGLALDGDGNLFVSDFGVAEDFSPRSRIRKVSTTGTITTIAGTGIAGDTGDDGPATSAQIYAGPLAVDRNNNLYFGDFTLSVVRKISAAGIITTIAGAGSSTMDGVPAKQANVGDVYAITTDSSGNIFLAASDHRVREISASTGIITTVAGKLIPFGSAGYSGDGGPATNAQISDPLGVAFDASGNLFIADHGNHRIRRVSPDGIITTIAGNGSPGYSGDGGLALNAQIQPDGLAVGNTLGKTGKIYFNDSGAVRVLTPTGCDYSVSATLLQSSVPGGSFPLAISTGAGCAWTVAGLPDWITISGAFTFSGAATANLMVASNSGAPRSANISIAGITVAVSQASSVLLVNAGGLVNSASYKPSVSPGSIVSLFGNFLLSDPLAVSSFPLPTSLGGLAIQFAGAPLAPLFYASASQVNAQIPWELAGQSQVSTTAINNDRTSAPYVYNLATYAPGLFSINGQGTGQGAILDAKFHLVDSTNPAVAGSTVVQIFCTGLGPVRNQPATGAPAPSGPLATTTLTPTVTIGGVPASVPFAGLTPGFVGLYQVNALVPQTVGMGAAPVTISIGDVLSNTVTMAVK